MAVVITVNIQKGGVGKTTTAHELASNLHEMGHRVLAIDLDQQQNLSAIAGAKLVGYYNTIRDNDTEVWEYWDECLKYNQAMDSDQIKMLKAIANSNETIVRFQGDNYHYDLYVKEADKKMIRDALALYEAMLG